jgi:hypothetical protein
MSPFPGAGREFVDKAVFEKGRIVPSLVPMPVARNPLPMKTNYFFPWAGIPAML